ncbi:uncharacterized protein LOC126823563 isoform X2 [Patella vulgata]|uniref:uncharacterized protein LOC126823563 isoform X2 n=1 Tax=Patella vulgata TaxID=6465 RepID=UPI0024A8CEEF|nr:uncharacterized protein LOC126823563 isoform X2 [Patella vulgata]
MFSLVALGVLSFITNSFAICPENPELRAKECVAVFTRSRNASHQGPDAILQICSLVYGALDCLREILNDCDVYNNMGLLNLPEDYERIKSSINPVCAGDTRTFLSHCENKFNECGQYGAQLEAAGALDPVARCGVMRQHVECNDQLLVDCGSIMPEMIKQRLAAAGQQYNQTCVGNDLADDVVSDISKRAIAIDHVVSDISKRVNAIVDVISDISKRDDDTGGLDFRISRQECSTRLMKCVPYLSAISSTSSDSSLSEMCMHATQAITCLEEFSSKCSTVFPNIKLSELEDSIVPLRVLCNQDSNEINLTQSNTLGARATEKECQEMGESCLAIVESLGIARGQREVMCNGIRSMLSCFQNVLTECADQLQNYNVDTMMAAYQQQLGIYCNGNENEIGGSGPMSGGPGPRPGRPGPMADGPGPQQVLFQCENKFNECGQYGAQLEAAGALDPDTRCGVMRQQVECNDQFLADCGSIMPEMIKQRLEVAGQEYNQTCVGDDHTDLTQSNTLGTRATEKKCQEMGESCLSIVECLGIARGQRRVICNGIRSMLSCLQNVLTECADQLQNYNVDTMMSTYQQQLGIYCNGNENEIGGPGPMSGGPGPRPGRPGPRPGRPGPMTGGPGPQQVLSHCENKFNECGQHGAQLEAAGALDPVARCVVMRQHVECNDQLLADCGSIMPERIKQRLAATGQQYNQICPGSNKAVVPKKKTGRLSPAKCEAMISNCKRKLLGYEAGNKEKCLQGYKTMRCYRRAAKVCKLTRPIRKEIKAFKISHINTCGKKKPRAVDDVYDLDGLDDSFDIYIAWLDGDDIDAD